VSCRSLARSPISESFLGSGKSYGLCQLQVGRCSCPDIRRLAAIWTPMPNPLVPPVPACSCYCRCAPTGCCYTIATRCCLHAVAPAARMHLLLASCCLHAAACGCLHVAACLRLHLLFACYVGSTTAHARKDHLAAPPVPAPSRRAAHPQPRSH
jgi:hypothetical protein